MTATFADPSSDRCCLPSFFNYILLRLKSEDKGERFASPERFRHLRWAYNPKTLDQRIFHL